MIEWSTIWETKSLKVQRISNESSTIFVLSEPLFKEDAISVEGDELIAFAKHLLETEGSE